MAVQAVPPHGAQETPKLLRLNLRAEHQRYFLASGREVPGCTTICRVINKEGLNRWYYQLGADGVAWDDIFKHTGADLGSVIHGRVEAELRGFEGLDPTGIEPEMLEASEAPFQRFMNRWTDRGFKVLHSELQLVSETHQFGGTLDIVAEGPEELVLVDIKSSNPYRQEKWTDLDLLDGQPRVQPYRDVKVQLGGYAVLLDRRYPTHGGVEFSLEVWRLGKTAEDPGQVHVIKDAQKCREAFLAARQLYEILWEIS